MSESFSFCDGGICSAPQSSFSPAALYESSAFSRSCPSCTDNLAFTPIQGYDNVQGPIQSVEGSIPSAFKPEEGVRYESSDKLKPVSSDRGRITDKESPKINVSPVDPNKSADIMIKKDGVVSIANGIEYGDRPLTEYNLQVEDGVNQKQVEKVVSDLADLISSKCRSSCVPVIDSTRDALGHDLVSSDFKERIRRRFAPDRDDGKDEDKDDGDLPDNPDEGGGQPGPCPKPGPGPGPQPGPQPGPDDGSDDLKPDKDDKVDPGADRSYRDRGFQALNRLSNALADMHPIHYAKWLGLKFLPSGAMSEIGDPPWTGEKLQKLMGYLKAHQGDITQRLQNDAATLEKQGDTESAKAIKDFSNSFQSALDDPQKLESFSTTLSGFMDRINNGTANTTDVHNMFNNQPALEKAVRHLELIEAGRKYATTNSDGSPDLTKISNEKADKLIAELQLGPKKT